MIKYRGTYRVYLPLLDDGSSTPNEDDTYLRCPSGKATIHRYNLNTLSIYFYSIGCANNRVRELGELGVKLTLFKDGDGERVYHFHEKDMDIVAQVLKPIVQGKNKSPRVRKKRQLSEEEKERLRKQLEKARLMKNQK